MKSRQGSLIESTATPEENMGPCCRGKHERERESGGECNQHVKRNHMTDEDLLRVEMGLSEN